LLHIPQREINLLKNAVATLRLDLHLLSVLGNEIAERSSAIIEAVYLASLCFVIRKQSGVEGLEVGALSVRCRWSGGLGYVISNTPRPYWQSLRPQPSLYVPSVLLVLRVHFFQLYSQVPLFALLFAITSRLIPARKFHCVQLLFQMLSLFFIFGVSAIVLHERQLRGGELQRQSFNCRALKKGVGAQHQM
jgi:hypothetical protein